MMRSRTEQIIDVVRNYCFIAVLLGGLGIPVAVFLNLFQVYSLPDWSWNNGQSSLPGILVYIGGWTVAFILVIALSLSGEILERIREQ